MAKSLKRVLVALGVALMLVSGISAAEMSAEELLFMDIPQVISAGKRVQKSTEAPATIDVITAEDIKAYGAVTVPDALRMVAGVDVMNIASTQQEVSIRGFNGSLSNRVLVMVDGVPLNLNMYGNAVWSMLTVSLDEIERIEVVKSPISSLYGASAYCGVINIITKKPADIGGTKVIARGGNMKQLSGALIHGLEIGQVSYKVSGQWSTTNEWENPYEIDVDNRVIKANTAVEYKVDDNIKLSAGGSYVKDHNVLFMGMGVFPLDLDVRQCQAYASAEAYGVKLNAYYRDLSSFNATRVEGDEATGEKNLEAELQYTGAIGDWNNYIVGATYKSNEAYGSIFKDEKQTQAIYSGYFDDTISFSDKVKLTLGARYDVHPLTKQNLSPRAHLLFMPTKENIIKFSFAQAFRNPTYIDSYLYNRQQVGFIPSFGFPVPSVSLIVLSEGNEKLKPESIQSTEAEYRLVLNNANFHVNGFYNIYKNFIKGSPLAEYDVVTGFYTIPFVTPSSIDHYIPNSFKNSGDAVGVGVEIGMEAELSKMVSCFANYSYQEIWYLASGENNRHEVGITSNPKNKLNAGMKVKLDSGLAAGLSFNWVDRVQVTEALRTGGTVGHELPDYLVWNLGASYTFWQDKATISLSLLNVLDSVHYEAPAGVDSANPLSSMIGRKINVGASVKF